MSYRVVRQSKFRHIYGSNAKREQCYDNIRVSKSSWDSTFCSVNPKFLAVIVESGGGGAFLVLRLSKTGRISPDVPLVAGHKGPVLDISWCPHNDNVIASASEDCSVKVWQIPDEGVARTMTNSVVDLCRHQRRVGLVLWHPSARNVLLSAGSDNLVVIWDVGTGSILFQFSLPDLVYSGCWNWDGSEVLFTCRDRKIRRVDPRSGTIAEEAVAHEGNKASRAIYLKNGLIFTTGFTKSSERQYSLRAPGHLHDPIVMVELDSSNGVMFPLYDPDANLVYLCGKGDSVIRYFEVTKEAPFVHYINTFQSSEPQRAIGLMPKRGCDTTICEMARFYRLNNNGFCQTIPFVVPRKSELFQEDLYPDTLAGEAAISASEWKAGVDADPILISVQLHNERQQNGVDNADDSSFFQSAGKPNVLDAQVNNSMTASRKHSTVSNNSVMNQSIEGGIASVPADVIRQITHAVLDEVGKQIDAIVKTRVDEATARLRRELSSTASGPSAAASASPNAAPDHSVEIRKLKAVIVKHESRIRALESGPGLSTKNGTKDGSAAVLANAETNGEREAQLSVSERVNSLNSNHSR